MKTCKLTVFPLLIYTAFLTVTISPFAFQDAYASAGNHGLLSDSLKEKKKAAEQVLLLMQTPENLDLIIEKTLSAQLSASPLYKPYEADFMRFFRKHIGWASLKDDLIMMYADAFTIRELQEMIAFFGTATGKKYSSLVGEFNQRVSELSMKRITEHAAELEGIIKSKPLDR